MPALAANAATSLPLAAPARTRSHSKSQITYYGSVTILLQLKFLGAKRTPGELAISGPVGLAAPLQPLSRRQQFTHSNTKQSASFACATAVNAMCSASGQTQTVTREAPTITRAPVKEPTQTPKLDDGGPGLPPGDDGGGGGGGGGGGANWSGGFFLFGFLAFLGFLKDKESEEDYRDSRR